MDYTLIIIVLIAGGMEAGAHSSIQQVEFRDKQSCAAAAKVISERNSVIPNRDSYIIKAHCVKRGHLGPGYL